MTSAFPRPRLLLLLLGKRGAGKTTLAALLERNHGFVHYEMSEWLKLLRGQMGYSHVRLRKFVASMRAENSAAHLMELFLTAHRFDCDRVVITGVRHSAEIRCLRTHLDGWRIEPVYLSCGFRSRVLRTLRRGKRNSLIEFLVEEYYSRMWGDSRLRSSVSVLNNVGNPCDAERHICALVDISSIPE